MQIDKIRIMQKGKVSICIPTYNNDRTLAATLESCKEQNYPNIEIIVSDDHSKDRTLGIVRNFSGVLAYLNPRTSGIGGNLQNCINLSTGEFVVFMCADDLFANKRVISDIVSLFKTFPDIGYIGRWYYQFVNGYPGAVRVHRSTDPYFQADNPSGLAFRKEALHGVIVSSKIFVEAASIVKQVLAAGWKYSILQYDTIAVRIHPGGNTATKAFYYKDSPTLSWLSVVGKHKLLLTAYISFIQLKNWATYKDLLREIWLFMILRPANLLRVDFWFYALIALVTPRSILRPFTNFYKHRICRRFVKIKERLG